MDPVTIGAGLWGAVRSGGAVVYSHFSAIVPAIAGAVVVHEILDDNLIEPERNPEENNIEKVEENNKNKKLEEFNRSCLNVINAYEALKSLQENANIPEQRKKRIEHEQHLDITEAGRYYLTWSGEGQKWEYREVTSPMDSGILKTVASPVKILFYHFKKILWPQYYYTFTSAAKRDIDTLERRVKVLSAEIIKLEQDGLLNELNIKLKDEQEDDLTKNIKKLCRIQHELSSIRTEQQDHENNNKFLEGKKYIAKKVSKGEKRISDSIETICEVISIVHNGNIIKNDQYNSWEAEFNQSNTFEERVGFIRSAIEDPNMKTLELANSVFYLKMKNLVKSAVLCSNQRGESFSEDIKATNSLIDFLDRKMKEDGISYQEYRFIDELILLLQRIRKQRIENFKSELNTYKSNLKKNGIKNGDDLVDFQARAQQIESFLEVFEDEVKFSTEISEWVEVKEEKKLSSFENLRKRILGAEERDDHELLQRNPHFKYDEDKYKREYLLELKEKLTSYKKDLMEVLVSSNDLPSVVHTYKQSVDQSNSLDEKMNTLIRLGSFIVENLSLIEADQQGKCYPVMAELFALPDDGEYSNSMENKISGEFLSSRIEIYFENLLLIRKIIESDAIVNENNYPILQNSIKCTLEELDSKSFDIFVELIKVSEEKRISLDELLDLIREVNKLKFPEGFDEEKDKVAEEFSKLLEHVTQNMASVIDVENLDSLNILSEIESSLGESKESDISITDNVENEIISFSKFAIASLDVELSESFTFNNPHEDSKKFIKFIEFVSSNHVFDLKRLIGLNKFLDQIKGTLSEETIALDPIISFANRYLARLAHLRNQGPLLNLASAIHTNDSDQAKAIIDFQISLGEDIEKLRPANKKDIGNTEPLSPQQNANIVFIAEMKKVIKEYQEGGNIIELSEKVLKEQKNKALDRLAGASHVVFLHLIAQGIQHKLEHSHSNTLNEAVAEQLQQSAKRQAIKTLEAIVAGNEEAARTLQGILADIQEAHSFERVAPKPPSRRNVPRSGLGTCVNTFTSRLARGDKGKEEAKQW